MHFSGILLATLIHFNLDMPYSVFLWPRAIHFQSLQFEKKKHCEASMTMADIQSEMARSKGPRFMYLYRGNLIFVE